MNLSAGHIHYGGLSRASEAIGAFVRKNTVFVIAFVLAIVTSCIVTPDAEYIGYIDFKTITCLFCTLAVVDALRNIRFFSILAQKIVSATGRLRTAVIALVCITFIGSMLIANDMALLTFLPLGYFVLSSTDKNEYMAFTFIMQNIAANLGGMLTPFGNPQNLYLYSRFSIPTDEFMLTMLLPFAASIIGIIGCCFVFVPNTCISLREKEEKPLPKGRTAVYLVLFALAILIVFRFIPYQAGLIVITAALLFLDRKAIADVDWALLGTFVCFFIFAGNMSRIDAVSRVFSSLLEKNTLLFSSLSCQFISNVPSAILLSRFTSDWRSLLLGVNIGGTGTLIASLASLITFREYTRRNPGRAKSYIIRFSAFNFAFLAVLLVICSMVKW